MAARHELSFRPADELEQKEFEIALHEFVEREAARPDDQSTFVYAQYDAPAGRWLLSFETRAALASFQEFWDAFVRRADGELVAPPPHYEHALR